MFNGRQSAVAAALVLFVFSGTAVSQEAAPARSFEEMIRSAASIYKGAKGTLKDVTAAYEARLAAEAKRIAEEEAAAAAEAAGIDPAAAAPPVVPSLPAPAAPPAPTVPTPIPVVPVAPPAVAVEPAPVPTPIVPVDTAAPAVTVVADTAAAVPAVDTVAAAPPAPPPPPAPPKPKPAAPPPKIYPISTPEITMVFVKGGKFRMGCTGNEPGCLNDERPVHEVRLDNFLIGKYPVTQKQWKSVMGINPAHFQKDDTKDDYPVEQVSWNDIQEFIRRLNAMTGKKYRLPTEAEWEYAARGGIKAKDEKFWGRRFLDDIAWHDYNSYGMTQPVGAKKPNYLDIHDMLGNVWEWAADWYDGFYYRESPVKSPAGPRRGDARIYRGCSFSSQEQHCRISMRNHGRPDYRTIDLGFRLAQTP